MINVKEPGGSFDPAYGDGCTDDTEALQALIDAAEGVLYFPEGRYVISEKLLFPPKTGYHIIGSGMSEKLPISSDGRGAECALVWDGQAGGTMVEYQGEGLVWNGLSLWGTNPGGIDSSSSSCPASGGRAGKGILIKHPHDASSSSLPALFEAGKVWFPALMIEDCAVAVATDADANSLAHSVAFGFFWPKDCDVGLLLQHAESVGFTFEYVHADGLDVVFKVTGGGRIFTQSCRVLTSGTTVLEVLGGNDDNAFYHINGLALDDGVNSTVLLDNEASDDFNHLFRFTNAHFICTDESACPSSSSSGSPANCHAVSATIDRSGSGEGKTMLELVGCRGVAALDGNVTIEGAESDEKSHLIVRECEVRSAGQLIDGGSSNYTYKGVENYTFPCGIVPDDYGSG